MSLTVSFGRYLFWLLGEWTIPLILGAIFGSAYMTYSTLEILEASADVFAGSKGPPSPVATEGADLPDR